MDISSFVFTIYIALLIFPTGSFGATFTFVNKCSYTVWPGILANAGTPRLDSTGFELPQDSSRTLTAPTGWSGRFWGRTGCTFSDSQPGSCQTGDCGSGQSECGGSGAAPPATLAEFTLGTSGGLDFYDVSLVDGYNLPMIVEATGGSGGCDTTGCVTDLNRSCPTELRVGGGEACKSACEAFGSPEYCCSGAFNSPAACRPTAYSQVFKSACPRSYSYAYDDPTSTFRCSGADYIITFCPSMPSQKSSRDPTPTMTAPGTTNAEGSLSGSGSVGTGGSDTGSGFTGQYQGSNSGVTGANPGSAYGSGTQGMQHTDGSWLAGLAMGSSTRSCCSPVLIAFVHFLLFLFSSVTYI